jgi:hypothetical protein
MKWYFMEKHYPIRVLRGDTLLGTLEIDGADQPWHLAAFTPAPAFDEVRALFEEESRAMAAIPRASKDEYEERSAAFHEAMQRIRALSLRLVAPNGATDLFILHIDGGRASFRYANFVPYRGIDRYNWQITDDLLPGSEEGRLPGARDRWFIDVRSDTACLVYETGEMRREQPVGLLAIYEHKEAPRLVLNPLRFRCAANDDTVRWYGWSRHYQLVRVEGLADGGRIFVLLDLPNWRYSWLDGVDVAVYEV